MAGWNRSGSRNLTRRDDGYVPSTGNFVFVFFAIVFVGACCSVLLLYYRKRSQSQLRNSLPSYQSRGHQRSLTITTTPTNSHGERVFVYDEKMNLIANSNSPPDGPVPEIRITFPDEQDQSGQTLSGRVVVVKITDSGSVGMEPVRETLPPYQQSDAERFHSLDLERMGGLREKESQRFS